MAHSALPRSDGMSHPPRLMLRTLRLVVLPCTRRRYGVRVHHPERVPTSGPVILAGNHLGWLDGPLMTIHSPRAVHALTKREMFVGAMDRVLRTAGQIPVDRYAPDPEAVKAALRVLRDGGVAGIFPEGARGTGEFTLFQRGTAYLAIATGAPVVPVIFFGTRDPGADSHARPVRGGTVDVVYGEPWQTPAQPWPRRRAEVAAATEHLRAHLLRSLADAKTLTGRELPGPLPAGDSEREAAERQATT
ncbi:MAG: lysophospholipid acyltransferase family protein [Nocardioides sp.]